MKCALTLRTILHVYIKHTYHNNDNNISSVSAQITFPNPLKLIKRSRKPLPIRISRNQTQIPTTPRLTLHTYIWYIYIFYTNKDHHVNNIATFIKCICIAGSRRLFRQPIFREFVAKQQIAFPWRLEATLLLLLLQFSLLSHLDFIRISKLPQCIPPTIRPLLVPHHPYARCLGSGAILYNINTLSTFVDLGFRLFLSHEYMLLVLMPDWLACLCVFPFNAITTRVSLWKRATGHVCRYIIYL